MMLDLSKDEKRFWKYVVKSKSKNGCWLWKGCLINGKYGQLWCKNKPKLTHRISWELHVGPIPEGICVLHKCDTPHCVRPDHLFIGTNQDNVNDKVIKGRQAKGEKQGLAKISDVQAAEIKSYLFQGCRVRDIADFLSVSEYLVSKIKTGKLWKHVPFKGM